MTHCITDLISCDALSIVLSYLDILDEHKLLWLIPDPEVRRAVLLGWKRSTKYETKQFVRNQLNQLNQLNHTLQPTDVRYLVNGKLHRYKQPAHIIDNCVLWYFNDRLHREDGPAVVDEQYNAKRISYYIHNKAHRIDGPAIFFMILQPKIGFYAEYWENGLRHRLNQPAVIYIIYGQSYAEYWEHGRILKLEHIPKSQHANYFMEYCKN
jgi:hypothetical protein